MSKKKPNGTPRKEGSDELIHLLEQLKRWDLARQFLTASSPAEAEEVPELILVEDPDPDSPEENLRLQVDGYQTELITVEDPDPESPEEHMHLQIDRFQPDGMAETDLGDLLISDEDAAHSTTNGEEEALPPAPKKWRNPFKVLWEGFCGNLPRKGDSGGAIARKCGFLFSLLVMLVAIIYLLVDLLIIPAYNRNMQDKLASLYNPEDEHIIVSSKDGDYPVKMMASFKPWYDINPDVRGKITYKASGKTDFLNIDHPIVYRDVDDLTNPYLKTDFYGNANRNGTLFFDQSNKVDSYLDKNRNLIIYGHDMASGQMFAGLNKFLGNVNYARSAPTMTVSTLFRTDVYKVFAVVLVDEDDKNARSYNAWDTHFSGDEEFLTYLQDAQARSLFDYPVDVTADDRIVVLSTCTRKSTSKLENGRLLVMARRLRDGESEVVDTKQIAKNTDAIMPYYWYINQNRKPHDFYVDGGMDTHPTTSTTTSTTTGTTLPTEGDATTTLPVDGEDATTSATEGAESTTQPVESTTTTGGDVTGTTTTGTTTTSTTATTTTGTTAACTHKYTEAVTTEPTCAKDGVKTFTCSACGHSYTETIAATGNHTYDGDCDAECNVCAATRTVEDSMHTYQETGRKDATCGDDGIIYKECSVCHKTKNESIPSTGVHNYDEDGGCIDCGAIKPAE